MITKAEAIFSLIPSAEFSITGNGIDGIVKWIKPSIAPIQEDQIRAEYEKLLAEEPNKNAKSNRAAAYKEEADPLFFKAQRGEATIEEWNSKVTEIRNRFPYQE